MRSLLFNKYDRFSLSLAFLIRFLEELSEKKFEFLVPIIMPAIMINIIAISSPYFNRNSPKKESIHLRSKTTKITINDIKL